MAKSTASRSLNDLDRLLKLSKATVGAGQSENGSIWRAHQFDYCRGDTLINFRSSTTTLHDINRIPPWPDI